MSSHIGFQCFVHGLNCDTDAKILQNEFSVFGEVLDSKIIYDRETGSSRGFGFVTFKEEKSMRDAIFLMNGDEIDGAQINVEEARPRRCTRAESAAQEFARMIIEKEKKMREGHQ